MFNVKDKAQSGKQKIFALVTTLTDLNPNIIEISSPIEESNILLKSITDEINQLNTNDNLLKLANLAVLEEKLPETRKQVDYLILRLISGREETEKVCLDYRRVLESLEGETKLLNDDDPLKVDALGIVSINNLKLKNYKNQVHSANSQIETLEKFKAITLYHLSDTINSNKQDKDSPVLIEIRRVMHNLKKKQDIYGGSLCLFLILAGYNYLADKYHITYESTREIAHTASHSSGELSSGLSSFLSTAQTFGTLVSTVMLVAVGGSIAFSRSSSSLFMLVPAAGIGILSSLLPAIFGISEFSESETTYTEQIVQVSYDFYNFGSIGTIILMFLVICFGFMSYQKSKAYKRYSSVAEKLERNSADKNKE